VASPSDDVNKPTTWYFTYEIKEGHCIQLHTSLKHMYQFA